MSCHRPTARHCSCAPEPARGEGRPVLAPAVHPEPLATLPLREELADQLERELARQRPGTTTALVFCDLVAAPGPGPSDHARSPGAAVIGVAAARIRRALRRSDLLAHCGGGRFLALLYDLPVDGADEVASRAGAAVRSCLDEPVATGGDLVPLTPAVGVLVHRGGAGAAQLLAAVDQALDAGTGSLR